MNDILYLLDSVILIDHLNGVSQATRWLSSAGPQRCAISAITRAEVLTGAEPGEVDSVAELLNQFPCLPIDASVADEAARLRRVERWKLPDALQAAVARCHNLRLATRNTRDFAPERHGFVEVPYVL